MKKISILFGFLGLVIVSFSQISHGGVPLSSLKTNLNPTVPSFQTSETNVAALKQEDLILDEIDDIPWRYGYIHYVNVSFSDGVFDYLPNGDRLWRLKVVSNNAQTINLTFDQYELREGAQMFVYNKDFQKVIGAFTSQNNKEHGYLTTTLVPGEEVTIELYEPMNTIGLNKLHLERIVHGYRSLDFQKKNVGDSGSCNNNVICSIGDNWRDQIRSVGILLNQNNTAAGFCSGALINNTCNDGTPYFLTANHCGADASSTVVGFNFESTQCNTNVGPYPTNTVSGVIARASNPGSDMMLLELSSAPPASYNVYYAGWDRSLNFPTSQVGIHHPAGDLKKISLDNQPATYSTYSNADCWRIGDWEDGTTEGGSSGSPLFNQDGNIIGQLYGGGAACGNNEPDYYGRFDISWDNGTGPSNEVKTWLDGCNTNAMSIPGYDPNAIILNEDAFLGFNGIPGAEVCGDKIPQVLILRNRGMQDLTSAQISHGVNGSMQTYNWNGFLTSNQSEQIVLDSLELNSGNYNYQAEIVSSNLITDEDSSNDDVAFSFVINDGVEVLINIQTNFAGDENYFEIVDANNNIIETEGPFNNVTGYSFSYCLSETAFCVNMYDDGNDGLSPTFFFDQGNYQLIVDGVEIIDSDDINDKHEYCIMTSTGLLSSLRDIEFELYPNPNHGTFNISSSNELDDIEIFDLMGSMVFSQKINGKKDILVNQSNLIEGIYFVKIHSSKGTGIRKIMVK